MKPPFSLIISYDWCQLWATKGYTYSKPTGVYEGVFLHVRLLVEPFATVLAGIRPGVWMYEQVSGEGGGALEHFSTHWTAKRPLLKQQALRLRTQECSTSCMHVSIIIIIIQYKKKNDTDFAPAWWWWSICPPGLDVCCWQRRSASMTFAYVSLQTRQTWKYLQGQDEHSLTLTQLKK